MPTIAGIVFDNPFLLGPMAGVTDSAFRSICRRQGAAGTYTDMVSATALTVREQETQVLVHIEPEEHPCGAQIVGSEPEVCAQAAQMALEISGADFLDINMGCPVPKITGNGEGSALMLDPKQAEKVITAVRRSIQKPLTVKFRKGFDEERCNCVEFARMAEGCGVDAVCVHGRTRQQMYAGRSDLEAVLRVKEAVRIPVIASGDMFTPEDGLNALRRGVDFVMVARGAQGDPSVFRRMVAAWKGQPIPPEPDLEQKVALMEEHIALMCQRKGEGKAMPEARKHILWYLKGVRGAKPYKQKFSGVNTLEEFRQLCARMLVELQG